MMLPLDEMLERSSLTHAKAAKIIAAHTNEPISTVDRRLHRWRNGQWPSYPVAHRDLGLLGWQLQPQYVADTGSRARSLKANFLYLAGEIPEAVAAIRPTLKRKAAEALSELREIYSNGQVSQDQIEWWRSVEDHASIAWWTDYYLKQMAIAQTDSTRSVRVIYASAILKDLKRKRRLETRLESRSLRTSVMPLTN